MRYLIREKLFHLGQDSDITDEAGNVVYKVDGKIMSLRHKMIIRDLAGAEVSEVERKIVAISPTFEIKQNGKTVAEMRQHLFAPLHQHFTIHVQGQPDIEMRGKLLQHDFTMEQNGQTVATVSKAWVTLTDTYGLETSGDGSNDLLLISVVLALEIAQDDENSSIVNA
ncbi:MAG TPA: LURP-one-related family protein [Chloroflexota bacterium]|nr:LURP-one-related family protein [Chloroflexota bacterium]